MISSQAGLTLSGQDKGAGQQKYAAKAAGYADIEVHLNPESKHQSAGQIVGCKVLRVYPAGTDHNNMPKFEFAVIGGSINFNFDEEKFMMVASLLDDKEPGTVSPVGYNRDFLASHMDLFIVPDPTIAADIAKRAEKMQKKALEKEKEMEGQAALEDYQEETVDDLDDQIAKLQKKKDAKLDSLEKKSTAPIPGNKPPEVPKVKTGRRTKTPEEKKAWGAKMKAAREAKQNEKATTIKDLPKEENAVHKTTSAVGATE